MSAEADFITLMREMATHPGARGLADDAAVLDVAAGQLVLTHDMLVEGIHFLPDDPADSVAWKLVAVNMSDLAAKGAKPLGVLLGFSLAGDSEWGRVFSVGLGEALAHFGVPLLGGDTVAIPSGAPRALGLTAIGKAPATGAPSRSGANPGDLLLVSGPIGDAGAGLAIARGSLAAAGEARAALVEAYRRPVPDLELGAALAPLVTAMADISDGLLIDAGRMGQASDCGIEVDLDAIPLSQAFAALRGDGVDSRLAAAAAGDDYCLLFAVSPSRQGEIESFGLSLTAVGRCVKGEGLALFSNGVAVPLPARLGFEHGMPGA